MYRSSFDRSVPVYRTLAIWVSLLCISLFSTSVGAAPTRVERSTTATSRPTTQKASKTTVTTILSQKMLKLFGDYPPVTFAFQLNQWPQETKGILHVYKAFLKKLGRSGTFEAIFRDVLKNKDPKVAIPMLSRLFPNFRKYEPVLKQLVAHLDLRHPVLYAPVNMVADFVKEVQLYGTTIPFWAFGNSPDQFIFYQRWVFPTKQPKKLSKLLDTFLTKHMGSLKKQPTLAKKHRLKLYPLGKGRLVLVQGPNWIQVLFTSSRGPYFPNTTKASLVYQRLEKDLLKAALVKRSRGARYTPAVQRLLTAKNQLVRVYMSAKGIRDVGTAFGFLQGLKALDNAAPGHKSRLMIMFTAIASLPSALMSTPIAEFEDMSLGFSFAPGIKAEWVSSLTQSGKNGYHRATSPSFLEFKHKTPNAFLSFSERVDWKKMLEAFQKPFPWLAPIPGLPNSGKSYGYALRMCGATCNALALVQGSWHILRAVLEDKSKRQFHQILSMLPKRLQISIAFPKIGGFFSLRMKGAMAFVYDKSAKPFWQNVGKTGTKMLRQIRFFRAFLGHRPKLHLKMSEKAGQLCVRIGINAKPETRFADCQISTKPIERTPLYRFGLYFKKIPPMIRKFINSASRSRGKAGVILTLIKVAITQMESLQHRVVLTPKARVIQFSLVQRNSKGPLFDKLPKFPNTASVLPAPKKWPATGALQCLWQSKKLMYLTLRGLDYSSKATRLNKLRQKQKIFQKYLKPCMAKDPKIKKLIPGFELKFAQIKTLLFKDK